MGSVQGGARLRLVDAVLALGRRREADHLLLERHVRPRRAGERGGAARERRPEADDAVRHRQERLRPPRRAEAVAEREERRARHRQHVHPEEGAGRARAERRHLREAPPDQREPRDDRELAVAAVELTLGVRGDVEHLRRREDRA